MSSAPTPTDRIRLTISVSPEVHETFTRLANAGSMSISRAMGDWLGDTLDAAEFMASKMEEARAAPKKVMRELHAYALGLADETGEFIDKARAKGAADRKAQREQPRGAPSSLTGLNPPSGAPSGPVVPSKTDSAMDPQGRRVLLAAGEFFDKAGQLRNLSEGFSKRGKT